MSEYNDKNHYMKKELKIVNYNKNTEYKHDTGPSNVKGSERSSIVVKTPDVSKLSGEGGKK